MHATGRDSVEPAGKFHGTFGPWGFALQAFFFMAKQVTIIDAIRNRKLFGSLPRFKNLSTWTSWLVVLKAIFGLPMTVDDLMIFSRHTERIFPPIGGSKETYLIIGRRGGKSFISALVTCFIACFIDFKPFITVRRFAAEPSPARRNAAG